MFGTSAELRSDQSPEIKESGLVDVRADCLAVFGYVVVRARCKRYWGGSSKLCHQLMRGQTGRSPIFHQLCHGSEPHLLTIRGGFLRSARRAIPIAGEYDLPGISPLRNIVRYVDDHHPCKSCHSQT
jgi:hypothetical protein